MGNPTGFIDHPRELPKRRPVTDRLQDYRELYEPYSEDKQQEQAGRCMNCGIPFCHIGCPLGNIIPDWNDLVYQGRWREALEELLATNNFPEFTGRLCPAPCEEACVLGINEPAVTIEQTEQNIIEHAFAQGWVVARPPATRTGKTVAVIGSGPAGLAAAQQLNRAGHTVTVLERADRIGGLLRYGIPDFKLEKRIIDRRLALMEEEGITFETNAHVGVNYSVEKLEAFDAVVLAGGATKPRDLPAPGRELDGVHFAMDFLRQNNQWVAGDHPATDDLIRATDKHVIVIGGGDTGSDCIGTSNRHGAASVTNFELLPQPPKDRPDGQPWPYWPMRLRTSSSHEEGCDRNWSIMTKSFSGSNGRLESLTTVNVEFVPVPGGRPELKEIEGSEKEWPADLVLLALGFLGPEPDTMIGQLGLDLDGRGNVQTTDYMTSRPGVFSAGDMRRGQSLIVWAIAEGREAAVAVDRFLMGRSDLPSKGPEDLPRV
jgi:glutamate synthase (NADPH/NADH) small chain